jgi:hypothetical protein
MADERKFPAKVEITGLAAPLWAIGWLFTVGYVHLSLAKGFLAILLWPYYLGVRLG